MPILGINTVYGNGSGGAVGRKICTLSNVIAPISGMTTGAYVYVHSGNPTTNRGKICVYDENGNLRTGYGGEFVNATPGSWAFVPFTQPIVAGQTYRPCYVSNGTVGTSYENTGSQDQGYSSVGYDNEPSATLTGLSFQDYTVSMYINYDVDSIVCSAPISIATTGSWSGVGSNITESKRIYCIGSSTTAGLPHPELGGYRSRVQDLLRGRYDFDFVGSSFDGPTGYDNNHSGYGGATISGCLNLLQTELSRYMSNLGDALPYVILQIGDADVYFDANTDNYPGYATVYAQILDFIHAFNPSIRVICVNCKPIVGDTVGSARADYLNNLIRPYTIDRISYCLYCDIYNPIINTPNWNTLYEEQTHLSATGYQMLANVLYDILDSIFLEAPITITASGICSGIGGIGDVASSISINLSGTLTGTSTDPPIDPPTVSARYEYRFGYVNTGRTGAGLAMIQIHKN